MVLAYRRVLAKQQIVVFCNLDGKQHTVQMAKKWNGYQVLLANYKGREMAFREEMNIMEPYEFIAFGNIVSAL